MRLTTLSFPLLLPPSTPLLPTDTPPPLGSLEHCLCCSLFRRKRQQAPPDESRPFSIAWASRSSVPVRDRADEDPRRAQHPVPAQRHHRNPLRQPRQLRHRQDPPVGLAAFAEAGRHPGGASHLGRALRDGHAQQPHRARPAGRRQGRAQEDPRHRQRGAGVQRDRGGQPHRPRGQAPLPPLPQPPPPAQPPPARHRRPPPDLPAVHGDQRHHVLRAGAVQHAGVQERRVPLLGGHHGCRQRALHAGVRLLGGPRRPPDAAAGGQRADVPVAGGHRRGSGHQGHRPLRQPGTRLGHHGGRHGVHLRLLLRLVLGPARVAHPQRDVPAGDEVGGAERHRVREPALHLRHRAGVPLHALPPQVRHLRILLRVGRRHVALRALPAGDQERAHRGDDREGVEAALVLEALHGGRQPPHRQRQDHRQQWRLRIILDVYW